MKTTDLEWALLHLNDARALVEGARQTLPHRMEALEQAWEAAGRAIQAVEAIRGAEVESLSTPGNPLEEPPAGDGPG